MAFFFGYPCKCKKANIQTWSVALNGPEDDFIYFMFALTGSPQWTSMISLTFQKAYFRTALLFLPCFGLANFETRKQQPQNT